MFAIQPMRRLGRLPLVMTLGLVLMATGGVLDVVVHVAPVSHHVNETLGSEHLAHLVGIAGMVLVLAGVVVHGIRRQRRAHAAKHGGLDTNARR